MEIDRFRWPESFSELVWGGWTCQACDTPLDHEGVPRISREERLDHVDYGTSPPTRLFSTRLEIGDDSIDFADITRVDRRPFRVYTDRGEVFLLPTEGRLARDLAWALGRFWAHQLGPNDDRAALEAMLTALNR